MTSRVTLDRHLAFVALDGWSLVLDAAEGEWWIEDDRGRRVVDVPSCGVTREIDREISEVRAEAARSQAARDWVGDQDRRREG